MIGGGHLFLLQHTESIDVKKFDDLIPCLGVVSFFFHSPFSRVETSHNCSRENAFHHFGRFPLCNPFFADQWLVKERETKPIGIYFACYKSKYNFLDTAQLCLGSD